MLILKQFFNELEKIQLLRIAPLRDRDSYKDQFEKYDEYLTARLDFETKYARILRGIDILSDEELRDLKLYYDHLPDLPNNTIVDDLRIGDIIRRVESAI